MSPDDDLSEDISPRDAALARLSQVSTDYIGPDGEPVGDLAPAVAEIGAAVIAAGRTQAEADRVVTVLATEKANRLDDEIQADRDAYPRKPGRPRDPAWPPKRETELLRQVQEVRAGAPDLGIDRAVNAIAERPEWAAEDRHSLQQRAYRLQKTQQDLARAFEDLA